jgi:hypothetical protein
MKVSINSYAFDNSTKQVLKHLKQVEPEVFKQLRRDMRNEIKPLVALIKQSIPATAPLSGLENDGRLGWNTTNPKSVSITTSTALSGRGAGHILTIVQNNASVSLVDKAGMRNAPRGRGRKPETRFGENLTRKIGPSQRFSWRVLTKNRRLVIQAVENIIEKIETATNKKIRSGF